MTDRYIEGYVLEANGWIHIEMIDTETCVQEWLSMEEYDLMNEAKKRLQQ